MLRVAVCGERASHEQGPVGGWGCLAPLTCRPSPLACCAIVPSTRHSLAGAPRPGVRATALEMACGRDDASNSWEDGALGSALDAISGVGSTARMSDASRPLSLALARAGALGAVARLAQHWVAASEEPQREREAYSAASCMQRMLQAVDRHLPEVRARSAPPMLSAAAGRSWGR